MGVHRVRPGEVWALGRHRLMCGDATSPDDVARLLAGDIPNLMVSDPPYGVMCDPSWRKNNFGHRRTGRAIKNDSRSDWSAGWALFPGNVAYTWHGGKYPDIASLALRRAGFEIRAQIIWAKPNHAISRGHYHWKHESCLYAVRKGATADWTGDRRQTTLWPIKPEPRAKQEGPKAYSGHGTRKPVEAMVRPMQNHGRAGETVYDPFVGSGTTIIAAEREGRSCLAMDVDPVCCRMALERFAAETGIAPQLI